MAGTKTNAAHCADSPAISLVYYDGQTAKAVTPRVVARISDPKKLLDFAVLHVDAVLPEIFEWADESEIQKKSQVIAVGSTAFSLEGGSSGFVQLTCIAGHIVSSRSSPGSSVMIFGDLPMRQGDSGGPLATVGGKLLGVHLGTATSRTTKARSVAVRPDLSRLAHLIAQDRASHPVGSISPTPAITRHKGTAGFTSKLF
jgi:S1-C subfamily serine protease